MKGITMNTPQGDMEDWLLKLDRWETTLGNMWFIIDPMQTCKEGLPKKIYDLLSEVASERVKLHRTYTKLYPV